MLFSMIGVGPMEMAVIGVIGVLLFGHRLPSIARSVGSSFQEFRKGVKGIEEFKDEFQQETREVSLALKDK